MEATRQPGLHYEPQLRARNDDGPSRQRLDSILPYFWFRLKQGSQKHPQRRSNWTPTQMGCQCFRLRHFDHLYAACPSCHNPPNLCWLWTGIKWSSYSSKDQKLKKSNLQSNLHQYSTWRTFSRLAVSSGNLYVFARLHIHFCFLVFHFSGFSFRFLCGRLS